MTVGKNKNRKVALLVLGLVLVILSCVDILPPNQWQRANEQEKEFFQRQRMLEQRVGSPQLVHPKNNGFDQ